MPVSMTIRHPPRRLEGRTTPRRALVVEGVLFLFFHRVHVPQLFHDLKQLAQGRGSRVGENLPLSRALLPRLVSSFAGCPAADPDSHGGIRVFAVGVVFSGDLAGVFVVTIPRMVAIPCQVVFPLSGVITCHATPSNIAVGAGRFPRGGSMCYEPGPRASRPHSTPWTRSPCLFPPFCHPDDSASSSAAGSGRNCDSSNVRTSGASAGNAAVTKTMPVTTIAGRAAGC